MIEITALYSSKERRISFTMEDYQRMAEAVVAEVHYEINNKTGKITVFLIDRLGKAIKRGLFKLLAKAATECQNS